MTTDVENRLFVIRNLEAFAELQGVAPGSAYEFEVLTEVHAHGEFQRGPFSLVPWDAEPAPPGAPRSLVLTIVNCLPEIGAPDKATKGGFYHGVTMPAEICALATTVLRRRVSLGALVRADGVPLRQTPRIPRRHDGLLAGEIDLADLGGWLDLVAKLPDGFHHTFILACRTYQEAIGLIDHKPDLAYLLLVTCIEVFVSKYYPETTEAELSPRVRDALNACADPAARKVLLARILELDYGITRNFVRFFEEHVSDRFWDESPKIAPEKGRIEKAELPEMLKRIYNQRSKTFHEAEPFPPNVLSPPDGEAEIDRRKSLAFRQKKWTERQMIPYARFFERLVQHVLIRFLETRVAEASKRG